MLAPILCEVEVMLFNLVQRAQYQLSAGSGTQESNLPSAAGTVGSSVAPAPSTSVQTVTQTTSKEALLQGLPNQLQLSLDFCIGCFPLNVSVSE